MFDAARPRRSNTVARVTDRTEGGGATRRELKPPSLGGFIRHRREGLGLTRQALATASTIAGMYMSTSYIAQLENGSKRNPTPAFCDGLARLLELTPIECDHLKYLAERTEIGPRAADPVPVESYRTAISADMRRAAQGLDPHLVGYLDERWNIIEVNDAYAAAWPELMEFGNVLRWFFQSPASRKVMVEWEAEAELTVHWLQWMMGRYGSPDWALQLLSELSGDPDFARMWESQKVGAGRPQPYMHLRDLRTGELTSVNVQITQVELSGVPPMLMFLGVRGPYCGPPHLADPPLPSTACG